VARITVLDYDSGNLHSVSRAIAKVGGDVDVTSDPSRVASADAIVIPGVGHFGQCMRALRDRGLDVAAKDFAGTGRPVFGVCVGMQILFDGSDESDVPGLGRLAGRVHRLGEHPGRRRFEGVRVPHIGWNTVEWTTMPHEHAYLRGLPSNAYFYFVHSFAPSPSYPETLGVTTHGWGFASVVARDNVFATQFHPEKSGDTGLQLYENFVKVVASQ
jgi:glutamine amidotransferase